MKINIKELVGKMTLEEKASLCSGENFWETKSIERLGIQSIMMTDGPHGLRKQAANADHMGLNESVPATCFPTAASLATSWDRELMYKLGQTLGEECQAEDVAIILGPGINIKRSPLCGRNFEYFSEDPVLSGELGAAHVNGVQSLGIGTSVKHFAANNQEHDRMTISAEIDERTLREIYLTAFEILIKKAKPWTVMCAYNKINGTYCSENKKLLTDILREEWGFDGFVVSDWGAVDIRTNSLKAGLDLEMPGANGYTDKQIVEAIKNGELDEEILDRAVQNIVTILLKAKEGKKKNVTYDKVEHHRLAREIARDCIVLLKSEGNILPLNKDSLKHIAVIGEFAKNPRYQGGGSSHVNATKVENAYNEILKIVGVDSKISYAKGYDLKNDVIDRSLIGIAKEVAKKSEVAILFVGLPDSFESEGYDRKHMDMPQSHVKLIEEVLEVQRNVIVVLSNGSIVNMTSWNKEVKGILEAGLSGQAGGGAIADVLFGIANPSAKLPETIPLKLSDTPAYLNFPGEKGKVSYKEGIFVGYRYYDKKQMDVLYPFGHGLSYTTFEYRDLSLSSSKIKDSDILEVKVKVKNTGKIFGKEIIQLYVRDIYSTVIRPEKELKAFDKVELQAGEEKEVTFELGKRAFAYYDEVFKAWIVEGGEFEILIGKSSREICLKEVLYVESTKVPRSKFNRYTKLKEWMSDATGCALVQPILAKFNEATGMLDSGDESTKVMMEAMFADMPICKLINFSQGMFSEDMLNQVIDAVNNVEQ
ncbi:glycoside hydrolase family 3 C-terminal domain-containing protein [Clostridium estertheticum]|uniref:glycoside hydrolase family 3 C-terminal domain-containing protein n=1 Tax=Clostridium estertheticum TaxID=238834 RepID=UPI0013E97B72|nr:glycoside hydrolase family 3 C-terminal domain-containing protein [Clostridium estertheticum]MBZ9685402.1 glycoside hydrolase family 3 C-terminal domain-containing protein [Clostridium estertheticum]